jgi:CubicO group peptidase (beta-lactamase class C family)
LYQKRDRNKSFVSALVGIALDQGIIQGVEQKVMDFFPDRAFANPDPRKSAMTVEQVLMMSTGLRWTEGDPEYQALYISGDWVANMLGRAIVEDRGHISTGDGSYGYQWWVYPDIKAYAANGRYGQMIFVQPASDLVVVFTATIDGDNPELDLIRQYVLPAIK